MTIAAAIVRFVNRRGTLVPHTELFAKEGAPPLPIRKVLVGPHPDQVRRQRAVELLLREHRIDAEVAASAIPSMLLKKLAVAAIAVMPMLMATVSNRVEASYGTP